MSELDEKILRVSSRKWEEIIEQYKPFVIKCASNICHKYITELDDEWSIALFAFTEAMEKYSAEDGSFLPFAQLVIKRRLIDYFRVNSRHSGEIPVNPVAFDGDFDEVADDATIHIDIRKKITYIQNRDIAEEIAAINELFAKYGFNFFDLTECSPKAQKTKEACSKAVVFIMQSPILQREIRESLQLPIKIIENGTAIPRKILERHRRYIIAAMEILSGEYPCLAEYMWRIGKELA